MLLLFVPACLSVQFAPQPGVLRGPFQPLWNHLGGVPIQNGFLPRNSFQPSLTTGQFPASTIPFVQQVSPAAAGSPLPYLDARALCSFCSCDSDFGCGYNCDKCTAICLSCDCESSLGCKYNCDKCEESGGFTKPPEDQGSQQYPGVSLPLGTLEGSELPGDSNGSSAGSTGSNGDAIISVGGDSNESSGDSTGSSGDSNGSTGGSTGSSGDSNGSTGGSTGSSGGATGSSGGHDSTSIDEADKCAPLRKSDIELCLWGPSCPVMITEVFPTCNYDCATCTLNESVPPCQSTTESGTKTACIFPFIYKGVRYDGCAPSVRLDRSVEYWCSTLTDINGFHVRGPYPQEQRYVGICDSTCPRASQTFFFF